MVKQLLRTPPNTLNSIESLSQPTKNDGYTNTNVGTAYEIIGNVKDFTLLPCKDLTPATYV